MRVPLAAGVLAIAAVGLVTAAALAAAPVIGLQAVGVPPKPGFFVFNAKPGTSTAGKVEITNTGGPGTVLLYPVDATTGQTTGAVYRSRQEPRTGLGSWLSLGARRVTLGAGRTKSVPFRVAIPSGAGAGQHLGGIVAQPLSLTSTHQLPRGKHSFRINIQELAVVAVQVDLPGARAERMAITSIAASSQAGRQTLALGLANTGNVLIKGSASLVVTTAGGRRVLHQAFNVDTFVPRTRIKYPLVVAGRALPTGDYRGTIALAYGHGHRLSRTLPFSIGAKQLRHLARQHKPASSNSSSTLLLILGGIALVLLGVGASAAYFKSQARKQAAALAAQRQAGASS